MAWFQSRPFLLSHNCWRGPCGQFLPSRFVIWIPFIWISLSSNWEAHSNQKPFHTLNILLLLIFWMPGSRVKPRWYGLQFYSKLSALTRFCYATYTLFWKVRRIQSSQWQLKSFNKFAIIILSKVGRIQVFILFTVYRHDVMIIRASKRTDLIGDG